MAVVLVCLVAVASLPCTEDFPHCRSITKLASSRGLFVDWVSDPSSLLVGALVVLGCAFKSDRAFLKTMSSLPSREENTFLEVAQYLPCVPRGAQGKQTLRAPEDVEVEEEKKSILRKRP